MNAEVSHIHLDAVGGIAGDMFCAALLDAFPELTETVMHDVRAVLPSEAGVPALVRGTSSGMQAQRFGLADVRGADRQRHAHDHRAATGRFIDMVERIEAASLRPRACEAAIAILTILAQAESQIHGLPFEEVHFHEIADWDSLTDVVAAGSIISLLARVTWSVSELPIGGGLIRTQHGQLPVPAPATVAILHGFRWRDDGVSGERVTPTGAAILKHLVRDPACRSQAGGRLLVSGTGAGTRTLAGMPNILRAIAYDAATEPRGEVVTVLSFDVDDMTGEEIAVAAERLRAHPGVRDVAVASAIGKKGRPLQMFRLLVQEASSDSVADLCFHETSTIGLRWRLEHRRTLSRRLDTVAVGERRLRVKEVDRPGGLKTRKIESDDLADIDGLVGRRAPAAAPGDGKR